MKAKARNQTRHRCSARIRRISDSISGERGLCVVPGAHDRLLETQYFLFRMLKRYHFPDEFRWNLHAFIQSLKSFTAIGLMESQHAPQLQDFRNSLQKLAVDSRIKTLSSLRDQAVHREPLLLDASLGIGMYRNGRMKLSMQIPVPSHIPSWQALAKARNERVFVPPHREWIGEECGVERTWHLPQVEGEIAKFCCTTWMNCAEIVGLAPGHSDDGETIPEIDCETPRILLEHEEFPEVLLAWNDANRSQLIAACDTAITVLPGAQSKTLHQLPTGTQVEAWTGFPKTWSGKYVSLLICRINGKETTEDTAGFYRKDELVPLSGSLKVKKSRKAGVK